MRRIICETLPTPEKPVELSTAEAHHLVRVLRLKDGDSIEALDGKGQSALTRLKVTSSQQLWLESTRSPMLLTPPSNVLPIHMELSLVRPKVFNSLIPRLVELGIARLIPVAAERCAYKIPGSRQSHWLQRMEKIADQSLKQCGRLKRLEIAPITELESLPLSSNAIRIWMDENSRWDASIPLLSEWWSSLKNPPEHYHLLIGPEGGWSTDERKWLSTQPQTQRVSLGPLTLKTETAALTAAAYLGLSLYTRLDNNPNPTAS